MSRSVQEKRTGKGPTVQHALNALKAFANDFSEFAPDRDGPPHQAYLSKDPIQFNAKVAAEKSLINKAELLSLSNLIEIGTETRNRIVRILATISCIQDPDGDGLAWLPDLEQRALGVKQAVETRKVLERRAQDEIKKRAVDAEQQNPWADVDDFFKECLEQCAKERRFPNAAEIAVIVDQRVLVEHSKGKELLDGIEIDYFADAKRLLEGLIDQRAEQSSQSGMIAEIFNNLLKEYQAKRR